jgi:glycosyltransferase involved in cell wall biosynthesis
MDVAFVTTRLVDHDAQGNFTAATLSELKSRFKGRVTLYTFAFERPQVEGVEVKFLGKDNGHSIRSNLDALLRTSKLAKELESYDLVILAGPDLGAIPAIHLAKRRNPRLRLSWVFHSMTPAQFLPAPKDRLLTRLRLAGYHMSMRRSDRVQTFSRFVKKELIDAGIAGEKITPTPFLIDQGRFAAGNREKIRSQYGCSDRFVLLYVGRLAPAKQVDLLLRAMAGLKGEPVTLILVGGGPEEGRLKTLAGELGVADSVRFAGRVPDGDLPDYYAACDAWVTASRHEGFCVPVVEAMAAGKPVIVPDVTAMPETADGAGLVYTPDMPGELGKRIKELKADSARYHLLSEKARNEAGRYDLAAGMGRYVDLIAGGPA